MKEKGGEGEWQVWATTDRLAAGRKELRDVLAEVVRKAVESGWVNSETADRWLEELESGRVLKEGWPKYKVGLTGGGALEVEYRSTSPNNIEREARRFKTMGLEGGRHFTVKMPEGGRDGYVSILKEGLERAAWLSIHGSGEQRRLAAEFVGYILERARKKGGAVYEKAEEVVEGGKAVGSLRLAGFEREVDGRLVKVLGGGAQPERGKSGRTLLRIKITAEVDGVRNDYEIAFGKYNNVVGRAVARADAPDGREADAKRLSALIKALTGREPNIRRMKDGTIIIECYEGHLEGFMRYAELADAIEGWLEEMG